MRQGIDQIMKSIRRVLDWFADALGARQTYLPPVTP